MAIIGGPRYAVSQQDDTPYWMTANQSDPSKDLYDWFEQAYANDPNKLSAGIDISQYMDGVTTSGWGMTNQQGISQNMNAANTVLERMLAAGQGPQGWKPWSSFDDFNTRQNARGGGFTSSGLSDFFSPFTDTVSNLANITTLGMGDTALANIFPTTFNPDVHAAAGVAGAGSLMGGAGAAGGQTGAGAGGMPAAVPATDPTFGGALSQTAPGVFTNTGNAAAFGAGLGAGGAVSTPISNVGAGIQSQPLPGGVENVGAPQPMSAPAPTAGVGDAGAFDQFGSVAYPEAGSNMTIFGDPAISGMASSFDLASMAETGLPIAGSLYQMYLANESKDAYDQMLSEMNSNQYDYRQNDDLVQEYLRNPMGLMKNHPGYQASVDYLTKKGQREQAAKGYTGSGNIGYYLADTLGKNASEWHKNLWQPISESAGLANYPNRAALGQVGTNAQTQIDNAKRNAGGEIFSAASRTLPDLFKWALS